MEHFQTPPYEISGDCYSKRHFGKLNDQFNFGHSETGQFRIGAALKVRSVSLAIEEIAPFVSLPLRAARTTELGATRQARRAAASLRSRQPVHQRAVPALDGRS